MGVVIRQSIKGTIVTYVGAFIGFLTTIFIVTKYLGQENYGLLRLITDTAVLFCAIGQIGTSASIIKFFPYFKNHENRHNGFFFYVLIVPFIGFLLVSAAVLIFQSYITAYYSPNAGGFIKYFYWLFPLTFFMIYQSVFETYSTVLLRIVVPKFIREILVRILVIGIYLLYGFHVISLDGLIISYVLIYFLAALINLLYIMRLGQISLVPKFSFIRKPLRKSIIRFTFYMLAAAIGANLVLKIDVFMVSGQIGLQANGIYNIALFMAAIVEMPTRSLSMVAMPIASEAYRKKNISIIDGLYKKVSLNQFITGSLIFLVLWINIDNVFAIFPEGPHGERYDSGKWVVFFLGISYLMNSSCSFGYSILSISKYYYYTLFFLFFLSFLTITTNNLLIPHYGIIGSALATAISFFVYNACQIILVNRKIKVLPFSLPIFKALLVLLAILGLNYCLPFIKDPIIDGIIRTIVFGGLFVIAIYVLKISEDINKTIKLVCGKVGIKLK